MTSPTGPGLPPGSPHPDAPAPGSPRPNVATDRRLDRVIHGCCPWCGEPRALCDGSPARCEGWEDRVTLEADAVRAPLVTLRVSA